MSDTPNPSPSPSLEASLEELKAVYRVLLEHMPDHPELEGNEFMDSVRRFLVAQATVEGVDTGDEDEWLRWLADEEDETEPHRAMN
jgi:hypothetical protein